MRFKLILLTLFLNACALEQAKPIVQLNGLDSYVEQFQREAWQRGKYIAVNNLIVKFKQYDTSVIGECYMATQRVIYISIELWLSNDDLAKEIVIYHELGHCLMDKRHDDSRPAIMNTFMLKRSYYSYYRTKLLDEAIRVGTGFANAIFVPRTALSAAMSIACTAPIERSEIAFK